MTNLNHALFLAINAGSDNPPSAVFLSALIAAKYLIALVPLHLALVWLGGTRVLRFVALSGVLGLTLGGEGGVIGHE